MFNGFVILLIAIFISLHKYIDVLYDKKEIQKDFNTLSSRMNRDDGQWICEHHFILWDIHAPLAWKHRIIVSYSYKNIFSDILHLYVPGEFFICCVCPLLHSQTWISTDHAPCDNCPPCPETAEKWLEQRTDRGEGGSRTFCPVPAQLKHEQYL